MARDALKQENVAAVEAGLANLERHIENLRKFGVPPVVALNKFSADSPAEVEAVVKRCAGLGVTAVECDHWAGGRRRRRRVGRGGGLRHRPWRSDFKPLYADELPLVEKVRTIAREIYRAKDIAADDKVLKQLDDLNADHGTFPICMAKTQYSISADPVLKGAPDDFMLPIREVRLLGGAEFVVVLCGDVMTMPGLPRVPAANSIRLDEAGRITGLF